MEQFEGERDLQQFSESFSGLTKREQYQEIVKNTISELYGNARYWDFFKSFNEESIHDFIIDYASKKAWYLVNGSRILSNLENEQFRYRELAEKCLWEIQQKKLFNMQAEWRAGLKDIDGIEVTRDFLCWEKAITRCPFVDAITKADVDLYIEYVESGNYSEKNWLNNWQDYDVFRNEAIGNDQMPAWYRFYDMKRGTGYLMLLPDKKGMEERECINAWKKQNDYNDEIGFIEDEMVSGPMPSLYLNYETLNFFIRTFENKNLLKFFEAAECKPDDAARQEELNEAIRILSRAGKGVQLPAAADWRDAVITGAKQYKNKKLIDNLPLVFEEYLFRINAGISFNDVFEDELYQEYHESALAYRERIREGKQWL
jgi:hypothetical protein